MKKREERNNSLAVTLIVLTCWIEDYGRALPVGRYQTNNDETAVYIPRKSKWVFLGICHEFFFFWAISFDDATIIFDQKFGNIFLLLLLLFPFQIWPPQITTCVQKGEMRFAC